jgi:4-diphosphocytidyl-2-C-methyl-D-erythritol kinase
MTSEQNTAISPSVTVRAAAKVNLHLGVGRPRPDFYHPQATV